MFERHAKTLAGTAIGAAILAISIATAAPASAADTEITIPDQALRACLNGALGQDPDAVVLQGQVSDPGLGIRANCANLGITDLTGIEYFTGLRFLALNGNEISDVAPLGGLGRNLTAIGRTLSDIHIQNNRIADLAALDDLIVQYYFFATDQRVTLPTVAPLAVIANPITNQDGSIIVPTSDDPGFRYDAATNTFTFATGGEKVLTWSAPLTPGSQNYQYETSGTITVRIASRTTDGTGGGTDGGTDGGTGGSTPGGSGAGSPATAGNGAELAATGPEINTPALAAGTALVLGLGALALTSGVSRRRANAQNRISA